VRRAALGLAAATALMLAASASASAATTKPTYTDPPSIQAPEAMLIEPKTGDVILARRPYAEHAIASTTKMMTALVTSRTLVDGFTIGIQPSVDPFDKPWFSTKFFAA
jgi:D-alanyl-D-alanine carboxypeptidase